MTTSFVIGAHGRTGALVVDELFAAGHTVTGTVRRAEHGEALRQAGARSQLLDLLTATTKDMAGVDAVVYAAGSTYGSSCEVVGQIDGQAIIRAADAAVMTGVARFVVISAHRTDEDFGGGDVIHLLRARRTADAYVRSTPLGWTIIRPDARTEARPTGRVELGKTVAHGALPRADLAHLIRVDLDIPLTARQQFEVVGGSHATDTALPAL